MRKGQTSLMVLIILIALFMTIYILVLPPSEREILLNQSFDDEDGPPEGVSVDSRNLLTEVPGMVYPITSNTQTHSVNSVSLYVREEPETKSLSAGFTVSSSLFDTKEKELRFSIDDLEDLEELYLAFEVDRGEGILLIELNGNPLYSEETLGTVALLLPMGMIKRENILTFKTNSIGAAFWKSYKYSLRDVSIDKVFERENNREDRSFVLRTEEIENLDSAVLRYSVFCNLGEGILSIRLNDNSISSESLPCTPGKKKVELDKNLLKTGTNELTFSLNKGDYVLDSILVETSLLKSEFRTYAFVLDEEEYDAVVSEERGVILSMGIRGTLKVADIIINGFTVSLDTTDTSFSKDISSYVREGNNIVEIVPKREFEITTFLVEFK